MFENRTPHLPRPHEFLADIETLTQVGVELGRDGPPLDDLARELMSGVDPTDLFMDSFGYYLEFMTAAVEDDWHLDWGPYESHLLEWPTTIAILRAETRSLYQRALTVLMLGEDADPGEIPRRTRIVNSMPDLRKAAACNNDCEFAEHLWEVTAGPLETDSVLVFEDEGYMIGVVPGGPDSNGGFIAEQVDFPTTLDATEAQYRRLLHSVMQNYR